MKTNYFLFIAGALEVFIKTNQQRFSYFNIEINRIDKPEAYNGNDKFFKRHKDEMPNYTTPGRLIFLSISMQIKNADYRESVLFFEMYSDEIKIGTVSTLEDKESSSAPYSKLPENLAEVEKIVDHFIKEAYQFADWAKTGKYFHN